MDKCVGMYFKSVKQVKIGQNDRLLDKRSFGLNKKNATSSDRKSEIAHSITETVRVHSDHESEKKKKSRNDILGTNCSGDLSRLSSGRNGQAYLRF